jgi:DNA-binding transcriptional MerR regulator
LTEYRTSEAAKLLGLKPAMLRRHAQTYEAVFGGIESDSLGRKFDKEFIDRLQAALEAYHSGVAVSVQSALEAIRDGVAPEVSLKPSQDEMFLKVLELLAQQNETITALSNTVATLQKQLEAPKDNDELDTRVLKLVNESLRQQNAKLEEKANKKWWHWFF